MSSESLSEITRASSCRQRLGHIRPSMVSSTDALHPRSKTAGKDGPSRAPHTWYTIAGKKSGSQDWITSNPNDRWATRQADLRIRNTTATSSNTERVHRNDEKKEQPQTDVAQTDDKYSIQDNKRLSENRPKQTYITHGHVAQRQTVRNGRSFRNVHHKKIKTLMSVYMNESAKCQRHERLLNKIEDIQISEAKTERAQEVQKEEARKSSWKRQVNSLRKIRQRFDEEQTVRFQRQFVSWKSVEKYRYNKSDSGLPDLLPTVQSEEGGSMERHSYNFRPGEREKLRTRNKKRYENILDPSINYRRTIKADLEKQTDRRNTLVLKDAENVLFNTEMDLSDN